MTNTKGMTMPQIDDAELFGNAEDQRAYEDFCVNQGGGREVYARQARACLPLAHVQQKGAHAQPPHSRAVRAPGAGRAAYPQHTQLGQTTRWWSLAEGDYTAHDGVLILVIDINGNAAMTVGEYEPLADTSAKALRARSAEARSEADETGVAPRAPLFPPSITASWPLLAPADECLCGTATLIEQLAQTKGIPVTRVDIPAQLKGALFLVSDEHGVVPATETDAAEADAATVAFFAEGYEKLRARR